MECFVANGRFCWSVSAVARSGASIVRRGVYGGVQGGVICRERVGSF